LLKWLGIEEKLLILKIDEDIELPGTFFEIDYKQVEEYAKEKEFKKAANQEVESGKEIKEEKNDTGMKERKGRK